MKGKTIILLLLLGSSSLHAQQNVVRDTLSYMSFNDIDHQKIELPPVSVFLDAAKTYAEVQYLDEKIEEEKSQLKISKKEWLRYFRLQGNYQYGTNNGYLVQSGEDAPQAGAYSVNTQSWYNVGAVVSIPLDDIFTRKNKNDVIKSRIKQVEFETARTLEDRQIRILEAYNEVVKNLNILKVRAEAVALYNAQMKISERDFVNGRIDIISLSLERGRRATAMVQYEESRAELHNAVTILEMLTKVKIIKK